MPVSVSEEAAVIRRIDPKQIDSLLQCGGVETCYDEMEAILEALHFREQQSLMVRLYVGMDIYIAAKEFAEKIQIPNEVFLAEFGTIDDISANLQTVDSTVSFLHRLVAQCIRWRIDSVSAGGSESVKKAKAYIDKYYMKEDLSLKTVAVEVGLSPPYLSTVFKRETNQNFSDYLTEVRIRKSKELLSCTSKLIYEIAYEVGFRDYRYFSQIFKKYTGQTPRQFQTSVNFNGTL